jgi:hypothetical protein
VVLPPTAKILSVFSDAVQSGPRKPMLLRLCISRSDRCGFMKFGMSYTVFVRSEIRSPLIRISIGLKRRRMASASNKATMTEVVNSRVLRMLCAVSRVGVGLVAGILRLFYRGMLTFGQFLIWDNKSNFVKYSCSFRLFSLRHRMSSGLFRITSLVLAEIIA